jgi:sugar O-acyltransferase (sialic acid O-acetyltransferase NeuD family)
MIFGAGAQGRVALDILRALPDVSKVAFLDENEATWGTELEGAPVIGGLESLTDVKDHPHGIVVAIGKPSARLAVGARLSALGARFMNAVHPTAVIQPSAEIGTGNMIGPGVMIDAGTRVGDHCIFNPGAVISHDCVIGDGVLLGPGARIGGRVTLGAEAFVGIGANVVARRVVGEGSVVAAGATVIDDVPPAVMVMGAPARLVWQVDDAFDWSTLL